MSNQIYLGIVLLAVIFLTGCASSVEYDKDDALAAAWISVNDSADFIGIGDFELVNETQLDCASCYTFVFEPVNSTVNSQLIITTENNTVLESVLTQGQVDAYVEVTNFSTCVNAGNPIMESYPEQCRDPETNVTYVNPDQAIPVEPDGGIGDGAEPLGEVCEEPRPDFCTKEYNPVCGSDGVTYGNSCTACSNENVSGYVQGTCELEEPDKNESESSTQTHVCSAEEKQAEMCTMEYAPVCGSDGKTYGNGCMACGAQVESYEQGEC